MKEKINKNKFYKAVATPGTIIQRRDILFEIQSVVATRMLTNTDASWYGMKPNDVIPEKVQVKQLNFGSGRKTKNPRPKNIYLMHDCHIPTREDLNAYLTNTKSFIEIFNTSVNKNEQILELL